MSYNINQEYDQQDLNFYDIKPEPVYEQFDIKQEPLHDWIDIKQEVYQHECCQPTINEEQVEPYQTLESHLFQHANVKDEHLQFDSNPFGIKHESPEPTAHTQNKPKPTKRKYAKNEKTVMWKSCQRTRKQLRLEKHQFRMKLRKTIRAFKNGPRPTVDNIVQASALLQASTQEPEEKAIIEALEKREYVLLKKKLEKSRGPKYLTSGDFRYETIPVNNDIKAEDVKMEDVKMEDVKVEDVKLEDVKVENVKLEDVKVENVKLEDVKLENQDMDMAPQTTKKPKLPQQVGANAPQIDNSNIGHKMLMKMGWQEGQALGEHQDGITEPVKAMMKNGRKGLGL